MNINRLSRDYIYRRLMGCGHKAGVAMRDEAERLQDEVWVVEYRAGDVSALEKLMRRWQGTIYAYCLTMLGEQNAALDACQEVWLGAIRGLGRRRGPENFSAWIYAVARNVVASFLRKKTRQNNRQERLPEDLEGREVDLLEVLSACEDAELVRQSLAELPLAQREVLALFYVDDLSLEDVARILRVPIGTVQSRLHYGRLKLKEALMRKGYSHDRT